MDKKVIVAFVLFLGFSFLLKTAQSQSTDLLLFPKENFTIETRTVKTHDGDKKITYRSYMHIPYVAKPVDKDYQSLNVSVPVRINDEAIDVTDAPICFAIGVGGYMSVNNARTGAPANGRPGFTGGAASREDLALASGFVLVSPGCRGRDNRAADGTLYGKAPAAIVDLKAAVRYIRHNKGIIPGNVDHIFSVGCSAGGALSALLGASGNSPLYASWLNEIGAADAPDHIYGSACFSPITDLEHADGAYEWMYGTTPTRTGLVDQELSRQLKDLFADYQSSLKLQGKNKFGILTAHNYEKYLLQYYLVPSANEFLKSQTEESRKNYLNNNTWIKWTNDAATFSFADYVAHVGRMKGLPAFDDFDKKQPEPNLFGSKTTEARHFTNFSLQYSTHNKNAEIDGEIRKLANLMNAMYFIGANNRDCAAYWWLRNGTSDNHTSQTVMVNLATSLENKGKTVNAAVFWDGGHCADNEPENLMEWIGKLTGYRQR